MGLLSYLLSLLPTRVRVPKSVSKLRRIFGERLSRRQSRNRMLSSAHLDGASDIAQGRNNEGREYRGVVYCLIACLRETFSTFIIPAVVTIVLFCLIFYVGSEKIRRLGYKFGLQSPALMTISILENSLDENFPKGGESLEKISPLGELVSFSQRREEGNFYEDRIIWKVEGFGKYIHNFTEGQDPRAFGEFENILFENDNLQQDLLVVNGLWIFASDHLGTTPPSIRAYLITDHVRYNFGVDVQSLEVAVSIKLAIIGDVTLLVKFEHSLSDTYHKVKIPTSSFANKGFCNYIFTLPFEKLINAVQIQPLLLEKQQKKAVALVDKVTIVVAKRGITDSVIHSMVPYFWCSVK